MPYQEVTFPDGTTFSNQAGTSALQAANHYGLDGGGHDPGFLVFAEKIIALIGPMMGGGAVVTAAVTVQTGSVVFATAGGWLPQLGTLVMAWRPLDAATHMVGTVTAADGGNIIVDVTVAAGAGSFSDWILTHPQGPPGFAATDTLFSLQLLPR
jgi:hypothetical protein